MNKKIYIKQSVNFANAKACHWRWFGWGRSVIIGTPQKPQVWTLANETFIIIFSQNKKFLQPVTIRWKTLQSVHTYRKWPLKVGQRFWYPHYFFDSGLIINIKNGTGLICWWTHKLFKSIDFLTLPYFISNWYNFSIIMLYLFKGCSCVVFSERISLKLTKDRTLPLFTASARKGHISFQSCFVSIIQVLVYIKFIFKW